MKTLASNNLKKAWEIWNQFWFESYAPEQMRLFRIAFGGLIFFFNLIRALDLSFFYGEDGILPRSILIEMTTMPYRYSVYSLVHNQFGLWLVFGIFLVSLACLTLGIFTRLSAVIAFALHISLLHRNPGVAYGIDLITTFFLFHLILAKFELPKGQPGFWDFLGSIGFRLTQIQVCIIYFYSGTEKLKGADWWRGEAVWGMLANPIVARFDYSWMAQWPVLIIIPTYLTLLWEIYFPVMIWNPKWRYPLLLGGVFMHFCIATLVSIPFFGILMITSYFAFLKPQHARRLTAALPRWLAGS